jgi:cytochrome c-type biogenesis protein CcmH/NrfG
MRRNLLVVAANILFIFNATAQPAVIDKNKVSDFFQNQQYDEALQYLSPALPADSNSISLLGYIGYAHYMNDNKKAALACYQHLFTLDSTNIPALSYLVFLQMNEDKNKTVELCHRLIALQPGKSTWWRILGEQIRVSQPDTALDLLQHAFQLAPRDAKNIAAYADLLIDKRYYPTSDTMLDAALQRDSTNLTFLRLRIKSAHSAGDYAAIVEPGERLIRLDVAAAVSGSLTYLALGYYEMKKYPDCIRVCEYMLGQGLQLESIYYYEARAWAKLKEYDKSNTLLDTCVEKAISKTADWYYYDMGTNYEGLHQYKMAIASYDTAYYLFKDPIMLYNCGRIAESNLKNNTLARKYYVRYLAAAQPKSAEEKRAYAYVRARWGTHSGEKKVGAIGMKNGQNSVADSVRRP